MSGRMLSLLRGRHCSAKYVLKIVALEVKFVINLLSSTSGGMFRVFFLFRSLLNAVHMIFWPFLASQSLSPRS